MITAFSKRQNLELTVPDNAALVIDPEQEHLFGTINGLHPSQIALAIETCRANPGVHLPCHDALQRLFNNFEITEHEGEINFPVENSEVWDALVNCLTDNSTEISAAALNFFKRMPPAILYELLSEMDSPEDFCVKMASALPPGDRLNQLLVAVKGQENCELSAIAELPLVVRIRTLTRFLMSLDDLESAQQVYNEIFNPPKHTRKEDGESLGKLILQEVNQFDEDEHREEMRRALADLISTAGLQANQVGNLVTPSRTEFLSLAAFGITSVIVTFLANEPGLLDPDILTSSYISKYVCEENRAEFVRGLIGSNWGQGQDNRAVQLLMGSPNIVPNLEERVELICEVFENHESLAWNFVENTTFAQKLLVLPEELSNEEMQKCLGKVLNAAVKGSRRASQSILLKPEVVAMNFSITFCAGDREGLDRAIPSLVFEAFRNLEGCTFADREGLLFLMLNKASMSDAQKFSILRELVQDPDIALNVIDGSGRLANQVDWVGAISDLSDNNSRVTFLTKLLENAFNGDMALAGSFYKFLLVQTGFNLPNIVDQMGWVTKDGSKYQPVRVQGGEHWDSPPSAEDKLILSPQGIVLEMIIKTHPDVLTELVKSGYSRTFAKMGLGGVIPLLKRLQ